MSIPGTSVFKFISGVCLGLMACSLSAQDVGSNLLYTVGTTAEDRHGDTWGYLLWKATSPDLLDSRDFAVYAKSGEVSSLADYQRVGVVSPQIDPRSIRAMVNLGEILGDDIAALDDRLTEIFQDVLPNDPNVTTAEKLSIIVEGAMVDPELFENVRMLARLYASVNLTLGHAYAVELPYPTTTFEIREHKNGQDVRVIGRVTLDNQGPVLLPSAGRPHDVPYPEPDNFHSNSPKGHLNARLRWSVPDPLRRLSLLQYGYNVYRVPRDMAEGRLDTGSPERQALLDLVEDEEQAVQVNRLPVLTDQNLTEAEAADSNDRETYFFADDNDRFQPGSVPFNDGDQFYYFVAPRDVLNRPGSISPGTLVTICDQMPPAVATQLEVENVYNYQNGAGEQFLRVSWEQTEADDPERQAAAYYVYRWSSVDEMHEKGGDPMANLIAGPISHTADGERLHFDDKPDAMNPDAPTMPQDAGVTYWYTVRSEDDAVCSGNLSGPSSPAYGVLRDREGPDGPGGDVNIVCAEPTVTHLSNTAFDYQDDLDARTGGFTRIGVTRTSDAVEWARIYTYVPNAPRLVRTDIARLRFEKGQTYAEVEIPDIPSDVVIACVAGTIHGDVTDGAATTILEALPKGMDSWQVDFEAGVNFNRRPSGEDCNDHIAYNPDPVQGGGNINSVEGTLGLTPTTREWKLYRRVNDGALSLVQQGEADYEEAQEIPWEDIAPPAPADTRVCYYGQVFDEHGNASPLVRLDCIQSTHADLPRPMLAGIEALPSDNDDQPPRAAIEWFCPTPGVTRFELFIAPTPDSMPDRISEDLSPNLGSDGERLPEDAADADLDFRIFQTQSLDTGFGGDAQFSVVVEVDYGTEYVVGVRAVGEGAFDRRPVGPFSNTERFVWNPPATSPGPQVPWPALGLDPLATGANEVGGNFEAVRLPDEEGGGVAVRIGDFTLGAPNLSTDPMPIETNTQFTIPEDSFFISDDQTPEDVVYRLTDTATDAQSGEMEQPSLIPFAIYRYQLPNDAFSEVSGTIVQVTPQMDEFAYEESYELRSGKGDGTGTFFTRVVDPFLRVELTGEDITSSLPTHEIYITDNHPVLLGAQYRYLFVRYTEYGEIDRIIPTNTVTISSQ